MKIIFKDWEPRVKDANIGDGSRKCLEKLSTRQLLALMLAHRTKGVGRVREEIINHLEGKLK